MAFTATNGTYSDLAWLNCNVVAAGSEIGTEEDSVNWLVPDQNGKTTVANDRNGDEPLAEFVDYMTWYSVDGSKSIRLDSTSAANTLTYPKTKNAQLDFSEAAALSFSIKVQNEGNDFSSFKTPVVRMYTDANNYVTFTPQRSWLSPINAADYGCGQFRSDWIALTVPFIDNKEWAKSVNGNVDYSNINYIEFDTQTGGGGLHLWIDGLKTISLAQVPYYAANLSEDATAEASSTAVGTDVLAPVRGSISSAKYWQSTVEKNSVYTIDYGTKRYIDRLDLYVYYNPTGNETEDLANIPLSCGVEYFAEGVWKNVTMSKVKSMMPECR